MNSKILVIVILGILIVSGAYLYSTNKGPSSPMAQHVHKDVYYCPMHPQIQSDKPGTCPICYMKLVKKETGGSRQVQANPSSDHAVVRLTNDKQQLIGIKTAPVEKKTLTKMIHAYGYVAHDLELYEHQLEYIAAWREYYAYVVRRPTKENFRQDWRDYYVTEASTGKWRNQDEVKAQERLIKAEYELRHMGLHDKQLAQLREIKNGQPWVQPDLLFFEEGHPTWVYADVFESDLGYIAVGQKVDVNILAYEETLEGTIETVANMVEPETRTVRVRVKLEDFTGELTANMYVDVKIRAELNTALLIPREAVMDTGLQKIVFVQIKEGVFEPRTIETDREGDGMVTVRSGLKEGETIVVSGNFLLDSESRLKAAIERSDQTASAPGGSEGP